MNNPAWTISNDDHRVEVDHGTGIFVLGQIANWEKHKRLDYSIDNVSFWPGGELDINDRLRVEPIE